MPSNSYSQLQTIRKVAVFPSSGKCFCTGISNHYECSKLPQLLSEVLKKQESKFKIYLQRLNDKISQYWPCTCSYYCGHICCIFTFGLSLCIPMICINEAQTILLKEIKKINKQILKEKKLEMRLQKFCCRGSQLVIEEIDFEEFEIEM